MKKEKQPEPVQLPKNILIGVPSMGSISAPLTTILIKMVKEFKGGHLGFYFPLKVSPVERARNEIVKFLMAERTNKKTGLPVAQFTHLLFIDSDTIPPADVLEKLLAHDKDIISGLTPILHYDREKMAWGTMDNCFTHQDVDEKDGKVRTHAVKRNSGLHKIWRCGTSCLLIKREVFEKLAKPYFKFEFDEDIVKPVRSEDLYFCDKAHEAGFEIWCDSSVICNHSKEVIM
jgi:GT2 family glycosyltransferase